MYELNGHDRAVISAWKPGGGHVIMICPLHGVNVERTDDPKGYCWCGEWCSEYIPETVESAPKKRRKSAKKPEV